MNEYSDIRRWKPHVSNETILVEILDVNDPREPRNKPLNYNLKKPVKIRLLETKTIPEFSTYQWWDCNYILYTKWEIWQVEQDSLFTVVTKK